MVAKGRIWSNTYFQRFKDFEADFLGTSDSERIRWISMDFQGSFTVPMAGIMYWSTFG